MISTTILSSLSILYLFEVFNLDGLDDFDDWFLFFVVFLVRFLDEDDDRFCLWIPDAVDEAFLFKVFIDFLLRTFLVLDLDLNEDKLFDLILDFEFLAPFLTVFFVDNFLVVVEAELLDFLTS